jgi:uncharacterized membrane protein YccC
MVRLTAGAVASYIVASVVIPQSDPLLAPLTALLVIQLTPVSILTSGMQRVVSVVAGVSIAVSFSSVVGLTWWSLATVIALSLLIGQLLRLGPNLLEVPISAMLVLGVGARTADTAAWQRIAETLLGASVGVLSNLLFPPKVTTTDAASAIEGLGEDQARLLETAARDVAGEDLSTGDLRERAWRWLGEARQITHNIPNAGSALLRAEESRKLNLRALGTADSGPGLRQGMEALEHTAVAVRSMFRAFVEAAQDFEQEGRELPEDVRAAIQLLLRDLSRAVRAFARLVRADAQPGDDPPDLTELREALKGLEDARARIEDLLPSDPRGDTALGVLTFSMLSTVERIHQELDVDERLRRQLPRLPTIPQRLMHHPLAHEDGPGWRVWRRRRATKDQG